MRRPLRLLTALALLAVLTSCMTTRNNVFGPVDASVASRQFDQAADRLDGKQTDLYYSERDQVLRYLDSGMLYHLARNPQASTRQLSKAEDLIEANYTKSLSNAAASFLVNDYALEYSGEAYEDLYLNVFKALDYMRLGLNDDAFVEVNRLNTKLNLLEDRAARMAESLNRSPEAKGTVQAGKTEFHNSALARLLSLLLYRADGSVDNALLDLNQLKAAFTEQPKLYAFPAPRLDNIVDTTGGRLTVLGFTGRSPVKRATTLRIRTGDNVISVQAEQENSRGVMVTVFNTSIRFPGVRAGYNFKAQTPSMYLVPSAVASVRISVDGRPVGQLQLLERLDTIAVDTFGLTQQPVFIKTVIRTVSKGIVAQAAKQKTSQMAASSGNSMLNLLSQVGNVATDALVDASEQADLRSARYFPGQAWVGDFAVAPGVHDIVVDYRGADGRTLYQEIVPNQTVSAGGLNVLDSYVLQ